MAENVSHSEWEPEREGRLRRKGTAGDRRGLIDPATLQVVATVPVGGNPDTPVLAEGLVWVLNRGDRTR